MMGQHFSRSIAPRFSRSIAPVAVILILAFAAVAQSGASRPRRVNPQQPVSNTGNTGESPRQPAQNSRQSADSPLLTTIPTTPRPDSTAARSDTGVPRSDTAAPRADTAHAYTLLEQKQYAAAASEAKQLAATNPNDSEAWKIAGFAEYNLKQYTEAASDLQRALDLQRAAGQEDVNTVNGLAQSYFLDKKFAEALPLLIAVTTRKGATPDALMLYYRGIAEYQTGKPLDAERSLNAAVKADPKNAGALFYLGQIAYQRNDFDGAIASLNRAALGDARVASVWELLTVAYLRRAAAQTVSAKADADYLGAVRAAEGLWRLQTDERAATLYGQALVGAKQYARAASVLERVAASDSAQATTLYLLGTAYVNAKNFPKAILVLERAAAKSPGEVNNYRLLGYSYEITKQYAKALAAYQKGLGLLPDDADLKESVERVRPFAK